MHFFADPSAAAPTCSCSDLAERVAKLEHQSHRNFLAVVLVTACLYETIKRTTKTMGANNNGGNGPGGNGGRDNGGGGGGGDLTRQDSEESLNSSTSSAVDREIIEQAIANLLVQNNEAEGNRSEIRTWLQNLQNSFGDRLELLFVGMVALFAYYMTDYGLPLGRSILRRYGYDV